MERRCYVTTGTGRLNPNLYTMLIGRPGVGKGNALGPGLDIYRALSGTDSHTGPIYSTAPKDATKEALVDFLASKPVRRRYQNPSTGMVEEYNAALLAVPEFGNLIGDYNNKLLDFLNDVFDSSEPYREVRRYRKAEEQIYIPRPILSLLVGTTPSYIMSAFPPAAWDQGFMARTIMVYSSEAVRKPIFSRSEPDKELKHTLSEDLRKMSFLSGEFKLDPAVVETLEIWHDAGMPPIPSHHRLHHYNTRRIVHLLKLLMVASVDRGDSMEITFEDFEFARDTLLEVEQTMPDIFMEMSAKSDDHHLKQLQNYCWRVYLATNKTPVEESFLLKFLGTQVPTWQVDKLLDLAERSDLIARVAGTKTYIPRPRGIK